MDPVRITTKTELEAEEIVGRQVNGVELVAFHCGDEVRVFQGRCPHQGTLLAEGQLEDGRLVCRGHGWQFDCGNGMNIDDASICLQSFSTTMDGDEVLVDGDEVSAWAATQAAEIAENAPPARRLADLPGPTGLPFLGSMHQLAPDRVHLVLEEWRRQYGDVYQIKLGAERAFVTADPEIVQQVLQDRPDAFSRLYSVRQSIEEMGIEGLFSVEGQQWRRHRKIATSTFDVRHLQDFFPTLARVTERLRDRWENLAEAGLPFDVQKEFMRYTLDVTANLAFGYDMNTLAEDGDSIQRHLERIFPMLAFRVFMPVRYWNTFKLPQDRALDASLKALRKEVDSLIEAARRKMDANPGLWERPQNLLQALLAAGTDEDAALSDHEIYGNVFTFMLAGEDTTANTMAWMMSFMTRYPEIQQRMQAEADAVLGGESTVADYTRTRDLRYIEAVAHETMRFKPVAPFLGMDAIQDVILGGIEVPAGSPVFLLMRPRGLEDGEFPEAARFKPERWLDYDPGNNPHHRKSFTPFGGGPRLCPGRSLALLEIKTAIGTLCRHFHVQRTNPEVEIKERFAFTMMPKDLMIEARPRG